MSLAVESVAAELPTFVGRLGGRILAGGTEAGFRGVHLRYAGGGTVELLEPVLDPDHPFLRRFLDRRGPGPHHLTFTTDDLTGALDHARALGWHPVAVDRSHPLWQEAFLHPREALGTTIQLAQTGWPGMEWSAAVPPALRFDLPNPPGDPAEPARLTRVDHLVPTIDDGLRLYRELLLGEVEATGQAAGGRFADVVFAGGGRVRLVDRAEGAGHDRADGPRSGILAVHFDGPAAGPPVLIAGGTRLELARTPAPTSARPGPGG